MYWSDWGDTPHISVAEMDGKGRQLFVTKDLAYPNGLSIDKPNKRLYWVDAKSQTIESIRLDGTDRRVSLLFITSFITPLFLFVLYIRLFTLYRMVSLTFSSISAKKFVIHTINVQCFLSFLDNSERYY